LISGKPFKTRGFAIVSLETAAALRVEHCEVALRPRVSLNGSELIIACSLTFVAPHATAIRVKNPNIGLRLFQPLVSGELEETRSFTVVLRQTVAPVRVFKSEVVLCPSLPPRSGMP
jgi:hypothetical protein